MSRAADRGWRRLLVALDASPEAQAALEAAAVLADRLDAELAGVFVEDEDLLRLARLPGARFVDRSSARERRIDPGAMDEDLRAWSRRARARLEAVARPRRLRWSFRVLRGRVAATLREASADADVVCLGRRGWSVGRGAGAGSTARELAATSARAVLVLGTGERVDDPVAAVHDGSPGADRAVAVAGRLARRDGGRLAVLLVGPAERHDEVRERVDALLGSLGVEPRFLEVGSGEGGAFANLARAAREADARLLVLAVDGPVDADGIDELLSRVGCALLLVR